MDFCLGLAKSVGEEVLVVYRSGIRIDLRSVGFMGVNFALVWELINAEEGRCGAVEEEGGFGCTVCCSFGCGDYVVHVAIGS